MKTTNLSKSVNGLYALTILVVALLAISIPTAFAVDAKKGEKLYSAKCGGCHDTRVHTRQNRIVHTYEDLVNRVRFCDTNAKTKFSEDDILDVSEYLNEKFYKFLKIDS